jgi:hypothetical protein
MKVGDKVSINQEKIGFYVNNYQWFRTYLDVKTGKIVKIDDFIDIHIGGEHTIKGGVLIKNHWFPYDCIINYRNLKLERIL